MTAAATSFAASAGIIEIRSLLAFSWMMSDSTRPGETACGWSIINLRKSMKLDEKIFAYSYFYGFVKKQKLLTDALGDRYCCVSEGKH